MNTPNFSSASLNNDFDEIIFERRNKAYGAYELRKHYPRRLQTAFGLTIMFCILLLLLLRLSSTQKEIGDKVWTPGPVTTLDEQKWIEPGRKPQEPKQPTRSIESLPTKVVSDSIESPKAEKDTVSNVSAAASGDVNTGDSASGALPTGSANKGNTFIDISEKVIDPNEVMTNPSVMPSFPGGQKALARYLQNHLSCAQFRHSSEKSGRMYLSFVVSKEGIVSNVEIIRDGVGFGCGEEAINVLQNMPQWIPGMHNNRPVNVKLIMPVSMETSQE